MAAILLLGTEALAFFTLFVVFFNTRSILHKRPWNYFSFKKKHNFPVFGDKEKPDTFRQVIIEGQKKFSEEPYVLPTTPIENIIVPAKFLPEIKSLPDTKLSLIEHNYRRFVADYTLLITKRDHNLIERGYPQGKTLVEHALLQTIRVNLTRWLAQTIDMMHEEAEFAIPDAFKECEGEWTEVFLYEKVLRMVALLSGRVFVGPSLNRNEEWIKSSTGFTTDTFLAELWKVKTHYNNTRRLLKPLLEERLANMRKPGYEPPSDMVQWGIETSKENANDLWFQTMIHLKISVAAVHSTALTVHQLLFDLAANPWLHPMLRKEIEDQEAVHGNPLTKVGLMKLKMLDSVMTESQRFNQLNILTMTRKVMEDVTLSNGTVLPKGSFIAVAAGAVNRDEKVFENPEVFDPLRFYNIRQRPGEENHHHFVTTGENNLNWGYGSHACPGRFFGSNEIKVILVHILKDYDFKLPEGTTYPENKYWNMEVRPDFTTPILFRKRDLERKM